MATPEKSQHAARALASLSDAARLHAEFNSPASADTIAHMADHMLRALTSGGKLLACGNGGSLCDSAHFVEELTGRFRKDRPPIAAIACADAGHITCTANDYGFDVIFSRWVTALARKGDCVLLLSTSGNSPNILLAAQAARDAGATVLGLAGKGGGKLAPACDVCLTCPGQTADRIQELHKLALHTFVELIEAGLGYA
jgi:D-sedoheptulose 7-phosphate isomerase